MNLAPTDLAAVVGAILALMAAAQSLFLLPYKVAQAETRMTLIEEDNKRLSIIQQELSLLRRDVEWMMRIMAKESGVDVPPFDYHPQNPNQS